MQVRTDEREEHRFMATCIYRIFFGSQKRMDKKVDHFQVIKQTVHRDKVHSTWIIQSMLALRYRV